MVAGNFKGIFFYFIPAAVPQSGLNAPRWLPSVLPFLRYAGTSLVAIGRAFYIPCNPGSLHTIPESCRFRDNADPESL